MRWQETVTIYTDIGTKKLVVNLTFIILYSKWHIAINAHEIEYQPSK